MAQSCDGASERGQSPTSLMHARDYAGLLLDLVAFTVNRIGGVKTNIALDVVSAKTRWATACDSDVPGEPVECHVRDPSTSSDRDNEHQFSPAYMQNWP